MVILHADAAVPELLVGLTTIIDRYFRPRFADDQRAVSSNDVDLDFTQIGVAGGTDTSQTNGPQHSAVHFERDGRKVVDAVFTAITDAAAKGTEVSISGFGKFKVKDSPAREGRNPATGAAMTIAASKKLGFSPAKAVKDKLNG